jgi:hypothetical protein
MGRVIQSLNLPIFGLFRQFPPHKRPFSELSMLSYNILITCNILEKNWRRFGWIWGESGPFWAKNRHSQNRLTNTIILYAYFVLNVPNERMTHPWLIRCSSWSVTAHKCLVWSVAISAQTPLSSQFKLTAPLHTGIWEFQLWKLEKYTHLGPKCSPFGIAFSWLIMQI